MSASRMRVRLGAGAAIALGIVSGCGEPSASPWPGGRELQVIAILDPDHSVQPVLLYPLHPGPLAPFSVQLTEAGDEIAREERVAGELADPGTACAERYGMLIGIEGFDCVAFDLAPAPGSAYGVHVRAQDRPDAIATTVIPGPFSIVSHSVEGTLPNTITLRATWRASAGVHRYVVTVRGTPTHGCVPDSRCFDRWFISTRDTTIAETIDASKFELASGPWHLDVYAMNEDAFGFVMTTGFHGVFPVSPRQNVSGGYGVVGAWVRRSAPLDP